MAKQQTYMNRQMTSEKPAADAGVRVLVAFNQFRVGEVIFPVGLWRDALKQKGYVEEVRPLSLPAQPELPAVPATAETDDAA